MAEDCLRSDSVSTSGGGLNDILGLGEAGDRGRWISAMEKTVSSRIPKLTFGFKKSPRNSNGTISEGNSPRGATQTRAVTPSGLHSAPGSSNTSPNLSRSKSLRVPRSNLQGLKSRSNSALQEEEHHVVDALKSRSSSSILGRDQDHSNGEGSDHTPERGVAAPSFLRPRSKTIGSAGRRPVNRHSRSMSPSKVIGDGEEEDSFEGLTPIRRSVKSSSAKKLTNGSAGSSSPSSVGSSPVTRGNSVRRSKTPTALMGSVRSKYSQDSSNGLVRTGSSGRLAKQGTDGNGGGFGGVILRKNSTRRISPGSSPNVKRHSTSFTPEDAGVYSKGDEGPSAKGRVEVSGKGRSNSLAARGASTRSHSSLGGYNNPRSPSPTATTPLSNHSSSSQGSAGNTTTPKPVGRYLSSQSRSSSVESQSGQARPSSATACYRRGSGPKGTGSTPSSGRTTPVNRGVAGKEGTDGGVVSSSRLGGTGLPPRTPYRVARTKAVPSSELTGMNELEGSVLLEADDYRRLFNEVKALKTALLRLKREIQEDGGSSSSTTPAPNGSRVGRAKTSPGAGQLGATPEYVSRKSRQEKEAMSDELAKLRKENKLKVARIENLNKELAKEKGERQKVVAELGEVTEHRDRLLDKVERLHADKHVLEARLNTLERASMYEQTWSESWLDELDGEGSSFGESLDADPSSTALKGRGEKKGTESDVTDSVQSDGGEGESSEPESTAVCSAPII